MIRDQQVRRLMKLIQTEETLAIAVSLLTTIPQSFSPTIPHPLGRSGGSDHSVRSLPVQGPGQEGPTA